MTAGIFMYHVLMKNLNLIAALLFTVLSHPVQAQTDSIPAAPLNQWRLCLSGGTVLPTSASMRGTLAETGQQTLGSLPPMTFPFGEPAGERYHIGIGTDYRLPASPWGLYGSLSVHALSTEQQNSAQVESIPVTIRLSYRLSITSLALGGQYNVGAADDPLTGFVRLGLTGSLVSGAIMFNNVVPIRPALRGGLQTTVGLRYKLQLLPFGVEVSAGHTLVNLIGKSYGDQFQFDPDLPPGTANGSSVSLNDGQDSSGAGGRSIDFTTLSAGIFLLI